MNKQLVLIRSVVAEVNLTLADQYTRNRIIKESIAGKVTPDLGLTQGQFTVTDTLPFIMPPTQVMVYIQSWDNFLLRVAYTGNTSVVDIPCDGLFILYGQTQSVEVHCGIGETRLISYVYA